MIGEVIKQTFTLMTAALGLIAALIWKNETQAWLSHYLRILKAHGD